MKNRMALFLSLCLINSWIPPLYGGCEVPEKRTTFVVVRSHPKTGKPYVSIISAKRPRREDPLARFHQKYPRPDYRMLDPKIKKGEISYEGPVSDRRKIYLFAATLATLGVAGGVVGVAVAPAAASTGAAGGGGAYLVGGTAVAAGSAGAVVAATHSNQDDFKQTSGSRLKARVKQSTVSEEQPEILR